MTRKTPKNNDVRRTQGSSQRKGFRKIAVDFPEKTFNKIKARAVKEDVSFSTMAVKMAECGLLDYEESELHEERQAA